MDTSEGGRGVKAERTSQLGLQQSFRLLRKLEFEVVFFAFSFYNNVKVNLNSLLFVRSAGINRSNSEKCLHAHLHLARNIYLHPGFA